MKSVSNAEIRGNEYEWERIRVLCFDKKRVDSVVYMNSIDRKNRMNVKSSCFFYIHPVFFIDILQLGFDNFYVNIILFFF